MEVSHKRCCEMPDNHYYHFPNSLKETIKGFESELFALLPEKDRKEISGAKSKDKDKVLDKVLADLKTPAPNLYFVAGIYKAIRFLNGKINYLEDTCNSPRDLNLATKGAKVLKDLQPMLGACFSTLIPFQTQSVSGETVAENKGYIVLVKLYNLLGSLQGNAFSDRDLKRPKGDILNIIFGD